MNEAVKNNPVDAEEVAISEIDNSEIDGAVEAAEQNDFEIGEYINLPNDELVAEALKAFREEGSIDKSIALARLAVRKDPDHAIAWGHLGFTLFVGRKVEASIGCFKKSLRINPEAYGNWVNLGNALQRVSRHDEALEAFERAAELEAGNAAVHTQIAQCHRDLGKYEKALDALRRSELLGNKSDDLEYNRTIVNLMSGNYAEGLPGLEQRWHREGADPRYPMERKWDGKAQKGMQLLIWADSGFNDIIMMARYVLIAAQKGMDIIFEVPVETLRLFKESPAFQGIRLKAFTRDAAPYEGAHIPLASLPATLGLVDSAKIPNRPYLAPPNAPRVRSDRFKVGIVWNGASRRVPDPDRILPLRHVARISDTPNTEFYSLQRGGSERELVNTGFDHLVSNIGTLCRDLADVAAFCENLDLLISVDSYQAHVAAAMGKKVWLLLGPSPDWRWQLKPTTCPWYPSLKIYRRNDRLHWDDMVEKIRTDLIKEAKDASGDVKK